jgi:hypothetical protein
MIYTCPILSGECMSEETTTTLDFIDGIIVPGEPFKEPANEYWALVSLWEGMRFLHAQVARSEGITCERINSGEVKLFSFADERFRAEEVHFGGRLPDGLNDIPMALLTSAFQWYAISVCQFVRLIGAIAKRQDNGRPLPDEYAKRIIPEVLTYRNKVAAHFAWSSDNKRDNDAERLLSVLPALTFSRARFRTGSMTVSLRRSGEVSKSSAIQEWSLTEIHDRLISRYFRPIPESAEGDAA